MASVIPRRRRRTVRSRVGRRHFAAPIDGLEAEEIAGIGEYYLQRGRLEVAGRYLQAAATAGSRNDSVYSNLGVLAMRGGDLAQARQWYDLGLVRAPGSAALWFNRATLLQKQGDTPAALADVLEAIDRDGGPALYQLRAGSLFLQTGRPQAARGHLERASALDPQGATGNEARRRPEQSR